MTALAAGDSDLAASATRTAQALADTGTLPQHPPTPLPGYQFTEITITAGSPAAGCTLADITWPPGATPVTVLRGHQHRPPHPGLTLAPGDRTSLLTAAPADSPERDPGGGHHAQPASDGTSNHA